MCADMLQVPQDSENPIGCVMHYTDDGRIGGSGDQNTIDASSKEELGGNSTDSFRATPTCASKIRTVSIAPPTLTSRKPPRGQTNPTSHRQCCANRSSLSKRQAAPSTKVGMCKPATHPREGG